MSNNKGIFSVVLLLIILAWLVAYLSLFRPDLLEQYAIRSMRPSSFPQAWFEGDVLLNMLIIDIFALSCALPLGTGIWLLTKNVFFLRELRKLPTIALPGVILAKFRGTTNFYLSVAFTWFVGIALFGVLLFRQLDIYAFTGIAILGSIGFLTFFVPQYFFHGYLVSIYEELADCVSAIYGQNFGRTTFREIATSRRDQDSPMRFGMLCDMLRATRPVRMWVYDFRDILILMIGQLLALGGVALQSHLTGK